MMTNQCPNCGGEVPRLVGAGRPRKYCCEACTREATVEEAKAGLALQRSVPDLLARMEALDARLSRLEERWPANA